MADLQKKLTILPDNPLCGISTYKDTLNLANGSCTRIIGKYEFTGQENWVRTNAGYFYTGNAFSDYNNTQTLYQKLSSMFSHYIATMNDTNGNSLSNGYACLYCSNSSPNNYHEVYIRDNGYSTANDFKAYLAQQYANGTPVTIWYVLAESTTETITVPSGLSGTEEGYLTQSGTPTPTNPIYPTANNVEIWQHSLRKLTTATDTITTLPADVYTDGTNATVGLVGNMQQSGTPTPQNPIQPSETGERTGNLFDADRWYGVYKLPDGTYQATYANFYAIKVKPFSADDIGRTFTFSMNISPIQGNVRISANVNGTVINGTSSGGRTIITFTVLTVDDTIFLNYGTLGDTVATLSNIMLNTGSTALPYEPYGYKLDISSGGKNLFDYDSSEIGAIDTTTGQNVEYDNARRSDYISVKANDIITISGQNGSIRIFEYDTNKTYLDVNFIYNNSFSIANSGYIRFVGGLKGVTETIMVNLGSTPLPYEPYNRTTTSVYLGEVQSTRRIEKLVLTGEEVWYPRTGEPSNVFFIEFYSTNFIMNEALCTHYINQDSGSFNDLEDKHCLVMLSSDNIRSFIGIRDSSFSTVADFKSYLAAQYAAGTPVCVWYVLATPETAVVNEPIRKIGDYADTVSGVSIPTVTGADSFDVLTTLKPSEVSLAYTGWHDASVKEKSENLYNINAKDVNNGYIDNANLTQDGTTETWSLCEVTEYIELVPNVSYRLSNIGSYNSIAYCIYDDNKQYITGEQYSGQAVKAINMPPNGKYVRFSHFKAITETMLNEGSTALPYEPYWK